MFGWFKRKKQIDATDPKGTIPAHIEQGYPYYGKPIVTLAPVRTVTTTTYGPDSGFGTLVGGIVAAELISDVFNSSSDSSASVDTSSSSDSLSSSSDSFGGFDGGSSGGGGSDSSW